MDILRLNDKAECDLPRSAALNRYLRPAASLLTPQSGLMLSSPERRTRSGAAVTGPTTAKTPSACASSTARENGSRLPEIRQHAGRANCLVNLAAYARMHLTDRSRSDAPEAIA
jgi:hypothetical protein